MTSEKIMFSGADGQQLAARLDSPDGAVKATALFAHCFTCTKDLSTVNRISRELNAHGIALFRFDFTGLGLSEGEFANTNFSSNVQDLLCATQYLTDIGQAPDLLFGHSLGGAAVLVAAKHIPNIKAVATIGTPFNATNVFKQFDEELAEIQETGMAKVSLAGRNFTIKKQFLEDAKMQNITEAVHHLAKPYLIMHSPVDEIVDIHHARKLFEAAMHPKSFIALDGADHLLMKNTKDGIYAARMLAAWFSRYRCAD